jgi:hypothetical protein
VLETVDIQTVSITIASAGVFAAAIYYILQIRHQSKVRQTDLVMRLYSTWGSREFRDLLMEVYNLQFKDYDDFVKKYGPWLSKEPAPTAVFVVAVYFQGIGLLLHRKIIDINLTYNLMGFTSIKLCWEKTKPIITGLREQFNDPKIFGWFEYLYDEMKKREQSGAKNG